MNPAETYILNQKEPFQSTMLAIRSVIFDTIPKIEEKYKYKIPFYYYKGKPLCYLNILKGKKYVDLGFWDGFKLNNDHNHLKANKRKVIKSLEFNDLESPSFSILQQVLLEAVSIKENTLK